MREATLVLIEEIPSGWRVHGDEAALELARSPIRLRLVRGEREQLRTHADAPIAIVARGAERAPTALALSRRDLGSAWFELREASGPPHGALRVTPLAGGVIQLGLSPADPAAASFGFTFDLDSGGHFYGLGELVREKRPREIPTSQHFPLDAGSFERPRLVTSEGSDVITPLFLTATGAALFHDSYAPLALSFNREGSRRLRLHLLPEGGETEFMLALLSAASTREVYLRWVAWPWEVRPPLPLGARPPDELFARPIWTTWAAFKKEIDQAKVLGFAREILAHGHEAGFLEIDDRWTPAYGDLRFREDAFPDAVAMIASLHGLGMKVGVWVPPFVDQDAGAYRVGMECRAFVEARGRDGPAGVAWWGSDWLPRSALVDFGREAGAAFWGERVDAVARDYGVDGFKYDGGESTFLPGDALLGGGARPGEYPDRYARFALAHRGVEVRAGYFGQHLPIAFRQFDKDSHFGLDNGLASVLTGALAMGLAGYPFVLPDMVGGNEYREACDDELFIRWIELAAFLPMIQLSIAPWRPGFSPRVQEVARSMMARRRALVPYLLEVADEAARTQLPMVRPLFLEFPADPAGYEIGDQYLLGSRYLVAPVLARGARARGVHLPPGRWRVADTGEVLAGPATLPSFPAPLERIPVFERL